jgi:hypothetical protein|eukprot:COSAG06_NODE_8746_length_2080_cov_2.206461_1_plen_489_part_00
MAAQTAAVAEPAPAADANPTGGATPGKRRLSNRRAARPEWRRTEAIYAKNAELLPKKRPQGGLARRDRKDAAVEAVVRSQQRPLQAKSPNADAGRPLRSTRPRSAPGRTLALSRPKPVSPPPAPPEGFAPTPKVSRPASAARLSQLAQHKKKHVEDKVLPSITRPCSRERLLSLSRPKKVPPESGPMEAGQRPTRPATAARLEALSRPIVRQTHEVMVHAPMERQKARPAGKREEVQGATAMDSRVEGARVFTLNLDSTPGAADGPEAAAAKPAAAEAALPMPPLETVAEPAPDAAPDSEAGSKGTEVKEESTTAAAPAPAAEPAVDDDPALDAAATKIAAVQRGKAARAEVEAKKAEGSLPGQGKTEEEPAAEPEPEPEPEPVATEVAPEPAGAAAEPAEAAQPDTTDDAPVAAAEPAAEPEPPAAAEPATAAVEAPPAAPAEEAPAESAAEVAEVAEQPQQDAPAAEEPAEESALEGSVENAWATS